MKLWLKIVCIVFLLYAAVSSLIHPLVPGGLEVSASELKPGENTFEFTGYNTHFAADKTSLQAFVAVDKAYYCVDIVEVKDNAHFIGKATLPDTLPGSNVGFYANTNTDGTVYVQKAVGLKGFATPNPSMAGSCTPNVASDMHMGVGYPFQVIIFESIRNLMWHVPMWFTMFLLMGFSFAYSLRVLRANNSGSDRSKMETYDTKASVSAQTGVLFCTLGLITGSIWARFTWGSWWSMDPQLNGAMVVFFVYIAYFILRGSINDEDKRARLSAIFNIFAFVIMVVLLMVMPRFVAGLHPGKSGNPAFSSYDLDSSLRAVFYPAVVGWLLLGYWIYSINLRIKNLENAQV
jgi:heme exporter protein C